MRSNDIESLMNFVYPDLNSSSPPPPEYFLNRMILAPRNTDVNGVNETLLDRMTGDVKIYYSADQVIRESGADDESHLPVTPEFLRAVKSSSLPPGELRIKVGCPLILMRNLSPSNGLCNGSRMTVVRMSERVLQVQLIGGDHDGQLALTSHLPNPNFNSQFHIQNPTATISCPTGIRNYHQSGTRTIRQACGPRSTDSCLRTWSALCRAFSSDGETKHKSTITTR
jgi:hypothetical protein